MTGLNRRSAMLRTLALAAASQLASGGAWAQDFPSRPLKIVVPFGPGGSTDLLARLVGARLGDRLKQSVVVENRAGASGNIGADFVAKSEPDGYTLVMGSIGTHATNPLIYAKMPYDPVRDFAPVALVGSVTLVLVVHPSVPAHNVLEFVKLLKDRPKDFSYASGGIGASQHLAAELFKYTTHTSMQHVPYKGSAGALADLLSGRVPIMFADLPLVLPHIESGKLRALAVADLERNSALPEVPTFPQAGVPGYSASAWYGLFAPAHTPEATLHLLQSDVVDILKMPEVRKAMIDIGARPSGLAGADLRKFQESEIRRWREVVRAAHIHMDA
jgi:tripartite-type tricarboxylate transporter receptor subunit TctC